MYLQIHLNNYYLLANSNNYSFQLMRMLLIYLELKNTQLIKNNSQALLFIKIHRISIITPRGWNG